MREFFDTSVLIAAFWGGHANHEASIRQLAAAERKHSSCATHTLAEVYATMTSLPVRPLIPPEQVFLFVEEVRKRLSLVSLEPEEYYETIRKAADRGLASGRLAGELRRQIKGRNHLYVEPQALSFHRAGTGSSHPDPVGNNRIPCKTKVLEVRHRV